MAALLRRLRTRKTHLFMLHSRLCSTFNSGSTVVDSLNSNYSPPSFPFPGGELFRKPPTEQISWSNSDYQFEKKWNRLTVDLFSFRDRYAADARLLSETIKSRQALLDETINDLSLLSVVPVPPLLPQQTQEIIMSEKLKNLDRLDRLKRLKDMLVKQDEMSAELTNCRRTLLENIIFNFDVDEGWRNRWDELDEKLDKLNDGRRSLRAMEIRSNSNPTWLSHRLEILCEKIKTFNRLMKLKEMQTNSTLTPEDVDVIFKTFSETSKPPPLDAGWRKTWSELNERWDELYERLMRLSSRKMEESNPTSMMMPLKILCERIKTLNKLMRLKEMLVKEDELSAELTSSRVTSLEEIIGNFSEVPPLHDEGVLKKWNELNERLIWFRVMELEDSHFLSMRANSELLPRGALVKRLRSPTQQCGIVYMSWLKPPQSQS
ncbi:hypothetical protein OROMI_021210 [Orobanche minor]